MSEPQDASPDAREVLALELQREDLELPLLPDVATEVLATTADEGSDAAALAQLIERDQSLASHILRVVNSPAFRGSVDIVSLKQAIARMGIQRIREIAITVAMKSTLNASGPYDRLIAQSWRTGLAAGIWSREIARAVVSNVEMAYLCGLLHNIGTPLLANLAQASAQSISEQALEDALDELGPRASEMLIAAWKLPALVGETVRALEAPSWEESDTVHILRVALSIARTGAEDLGAEDLIKDSSVQALNLYPDDVEALLSRREELGGIIESLG